MRVTNRLAGEAVGDESFDVVAHFDPGLTIRDRHDDQEPVVLAAIADALAPVLEHLDGVFLDVGVGLERSDGCDHDDVAGRAFQGADLSIDLALAGLVDHLGEIVDGVGQRRWRRLRRRRHRRY